MIDDDKLKKVATDITKSFIRWIQGPHLSISEIYHEMDGADLDEKKKLLLIVFALNEARKRRDKK